MTSDEYRASEQQRQADYDAIRAQSYRDLQAIVLRNHQQREKETREMTSRDRWTPQQHLDDALARLTPVHKKAMQAREQLRIDLKALTTDRAKRILTPAGLAEERQKALAKAQAELKEYRKEQEVAEAMLERRASMTGPQRLFKEAFAGLDLPTRTQYWTELMTAPPAEFAETLYDAIATHNRALVELARRIYERRVVRGGEKGFAAAGAALGAPAQNMELPKDTQALEARFTELENMKNDLDAAIPELAMGLQGDDRHERMRRLDAANDTYGPDDGPFKYVEGEQAINKDIAERATHRANEVITEAVLGDEADAAAIKPTTH